MALGLNTGGGEGGGNYLPICKFDARAGRLFKVVRTQGATGWVSDSVDITNPAPAFAVDFCSIEVGWSAFLPTGPSFAMVPLGQPMPAKPSNEHKQGFRVKLAGQVLDGVREFASNSKCVMSAIDALHTTYLAAPEAGQGLIPVVRMTGTTAVKTTGPQGTTTNYAPIFAVEQWVARPAELGAVTVPPPSAPVSAPAPATTPPVATHAPPPGHMPPPVAAAQPPAGMPF